MGSPQNTNGYLQPQHRSYKAGKLGPFGNFKDLVNEGQHPEPGQGRVGGGHPVKAMLECEIFNRLCVAGAVLQTGASLID